MSIVLASTYIWFKSYGFYKKRHQFFGTPCRYPPASHPNLPWLAIICLAISRQFQVGFRWYKEQSWSTQLIKFNQLLIYTPASLSEILWLNIIIQFGHIKVISSRNLMAYRAKLVYIMKTSSYQASPSQFPSYTVVSYNIFGHIPIISSQILMV